MSDIVEQVFQNAGFKDGRIPVPILKAVMEKLGLPDMDPVFEILSQDGTICSRLFTSFVMNPSCVEEQMAALLCEATELELRCWNGEDVDDELPGKKSELEALRAKGFKPCCGLLVFWQIDVDRSGSIDKKELERMLKSLPKTKPAPGAEFVPFESVFATLDSDGDGLIDEDEWLNNLKKLPGLKMAIESVMDPHTGTLTSYRTLPEQLAKLFGDISELQLRQMQGEDVGEELAQRQAQAAKLREKGIKPAVGRIVFRQIDVDRSGTLDGKELKAMMQSVPALTPGKGVTAMSLQEMIKSLDVDSDTLIDEDEFVRRLHRLPGLRLALEKVLDPDTGKIKGFQRATRGCR